MPKYTIEVSDENDKKFRSEFPEPEALFQKVVADAVQSADLKEAQAQVPVVERIDEAEITVTKE